MIGSPSAVIGNRAVDHLPNADFIEDRNPRRRSFGQRREALEIRLQQFRAEVPRDPIGTPRPRVRFPAAHSERAGFRLDVEVAVGVAQRWQAGGNPVRFLRHEILMLDRTDRHARAGHRRDFAASNTFLPLLRSVTYVGKRA